MIIELSNATVELKDELTFWDTKEIEATLASTAGMKTSQGSTDIDMTLNPEAMLKATLKTYEKVIIKITEGDKSSSFSEMWVKSLSQADGEILQDAVEQITAKKK